MAPATTSDDGSYQAAPGPSSAFQVGDKVFLKLQPYVQTSVARRANHKLSFKYYGPYVVLAKVRAVAYKLQLPVDSRIHPVFHVSQLKSARLPLSQVHSSLPAGTDLLQVPLSVQEIRCAKQANGMVKQGLIQWSNSAAADTTWENLHDLHRRFPEALAWVPDKILEYRSTEDKDGNSRQQALVVWNYGAPATATWEDVEALRRRSPSAPAWGQAGTQGGGNVSDTVASPPTPLVQRRSHREGRPNPSYIGPAWAGPGPVTRAGRRSSLQETGSV